MAVLVFKTKEGEKKESQSDTLHITLN
jgi:hypothetical protein